MKISTKFLNKDLWNDFESYFEYKGSCSGCWCMNHRYPIGLDVEGEAAKLSMKQLVESNRVHGVLAYNEGDSIPIGWTSLDRKRTLPGHDCIEEKIDCRSTLWSIHCTTVREDFRDKGVEKILMESAIQLAKELGANEVEAYPEPNSKKSQPFKTWNTFNGHKDTFEANNFTEIKKDYGLQKEFYNPMRRFLAVEISALETERLQLEPQSLEHTPKLYKPFQQKELYTFMTREPLKDEKQLIEGIHYLKNRMLPDKSEFCLNWVMVSKDDESYIGQVEVSLPTDEKHFYLAYTVFLDHQKKGYAKEACKKIIEYMFQNWATEKVIMEMDIRNIASVKLAESLGAKRISFTPRAQKLKGEWSDEYRYELVK